MEFENFSLNPNLDSGRGNAGRRVVPSSGDMGIAGIIERQNDSGSDSGPDFGAITADLTKTRCPHCTKLFSIETEILSSLERAGVMRADFQCTSNQCKKLFFIELPVDNSVVVTATPKSEPVITQPIVARTAAPVPLEHGVRKTALNSMIQAAKAVGFERECPRCGTDNPLASPDCVRCGVIFEKFLERTPGRSLRSDELNFVSERSDQDRVEEEIALGGNRDLANFWDLVVSDYEDRIRHERFLNACRDSEALSYASKKYGQILISSPQDDIARMMRNRIIALISLKSERSRLPIQMGFRVPKMNTLVLFLGAFLLVAGGLLPQVHSLKEIGISAILLSLGVQWALREKS